jgi:hypothetical protein
MTKVIEVGVFRIACCCSIAASQVEAFLRKTLAEYLSETKIIGIHCYRFRFVYKNTLKVVVR